MKTLKNLSLCASLFVSHMVIWVHIVIQADDMDNTLKVIIHNNKKTEFNKIKANNHTSLQNNQASGLLCHFKHIARRNKDT